MTLLFVLILATWRLSSLFAKERGMYGWSLRLRDYLENVLPDKIRKKGGNRRFARRLCQETSMMLGCVWCVSRPIACLLALAVYVFGDIPLYQVPLLALALTGGASIISEAIEWLEQASQHS